MTDLLHSEPETPDYALHAPLVSPKKNHYLSERPSSRPKKAVQNGRPTNGFTYTHGDATESVISNGNGFCRFLIGVAGGTASGKTSVCRKIMAKLGQDDLEDHDRRVVTISSDNFYRVLEPDERKRALQSEFNFDHPDALDFPLMLETVRSLLAGHVTEIPVYDFVTHSRHPNEYIKVYPADVILFEGILVFWYPELRNLFQLKLFVDLDADTRVLRRMNRDIKERGRTVDSVMHQYLYFVKPAFEEFCQPTKNYADVIIPRGAENEVAINLIVQHINEHLNQAESRNGSKNGSPRRSVQEDKIPAPLTNGHKH